MFDQKMIAILAGMFARTNMGMDMPEPELVQRAKSSNSVMSPNSTACHFCEQFMEEDSHEKMFTDEARSWIKELTKLGEDESRKSWPAHFELYDRS